MVFSPYPTAWPSLAGLRNFATFIALQTLFPGRLFGAAGEFETADLCAKQTRYQTLRYGPRAANI